MLLYNKFEEQLAFQIEEGTCVACKQDLKKSWPDWLTKVSDGPDIGVETMSNMAENISVFIH